MLTPLIFWAVYTLRYLRANGVMNNGKINNMKLGARCIAALPEPVPCGILAREIEMLHLRVDEMVCNVRHDIRQNAIRDDRNFLDSPKMLLEEPQVSKQRAKIFPAGKRFCVYQYSAQLPMPLQINIDLSLIHISEPTRLGMISYA